jgi:Ca2+-binding EF-hand superfamily protein
MNHTIMHAMVAGFFAAGIATSAFAADPAASLMSFDTDRNDSVSHAEFVSALKQRFDNMDKNANGKVTSSELRGFAMKQMMGSTRDPIFSRQQSRPDLPFGKNGEIDFIGFSQAITRFRFDPVDTDRNRILSAAEISANATR